MKRWVPLAGVGLLGAAFLAGVVQISRQHLTASDLYLDYSSLQPDPDGTKVLYDSLARLPGFRVERNLRPLAGLASGPPRWVVLAGVSGSDWRGWDEDEVGALDRAARAGSRILIAFRPGLVLPPAALPVPAAERPPAEKRWGAGFEGAEDEVGADDATREGEGPAELPRRLEWKASAFLTLPPGDDWRIWYRHGTRPVVVERKRGEGSLLLCADSSFLTNQALADHRQAGLLVWLVGSQGRALFDETHLGLTEDTGLAALARRYGLTGALVLGLLLAALWFWRRLALFLPLPPDEAVVAVDYAPIAGLEAVLRRAVPAHALAAACRAEWEGSGRPGQAGQAAPPEAKGTPVETYNAQRAALRRRPPFSP